LLQNIIDAVHYQFISFYAGDVEQDGMKLHRYFHCKLPRENRG
jgi:hypothetical protein